MADERKEVVAEEVLTHDSVAVGWPANFKALFDQHLRDVERERMEANDWHTYNLEVARHNETILNRIANDAATLSSLILAGEVDTTAQGSMANTLADKMRSVAFEAVQSAMAQSAVTSAPAQGTTGLAQGSIQTGAASANVALVASLAEVMGSIGVQLANIQEALKVILVHTTGEAVETKSA